MSVEYDNYLTHYGVKGMKWGVRKDQKRSSRQPRTEEQKAKRKQIAKKVAIGVGSAAVVAGGAYAAYKFGPKLKNVSVKDLGSMRKSKAGKNSFAKVQSEFQNALASDIDTSVRKFNSYKQTAKNSVSLDNSRKTKKATNALKDFGSQIKNRTSREDAKRARVSAQILNEQKNLYKDSVFDRTNSITNKRAAKETKRQEFQENVQLAKQVVNKGAEAAGYIRKDVKSGKSVKDASKHRLAQAGGDFAKDMFDKELSKKFGR